MTDPVMKDLFSRYAQSLIDQQIRWHNHPMNVALREQARKKWLAKPWWERAAIRSRVWVERRRERLGEIIAGRDFE